MRKVILCVAKEWQSHSFKRRGFQSTLFYTGCEKKQCEHDLEQYEYAGDGDQYFAR